MDKILNKKEIAGRLKLFRREHFDNLTSKLARALDISSQALHSGYLSGRSIPGPELLIRLEKLGCNIIWLLTGEAKIRDNIDFELSIIAFLELTLRNENETYKEIVLGMLSSNQDTKIIIEHYLKIRKKVFNNIEPSRII